MTDTSQELYHPTLLHPRTGEPLRVLGYRADGRPIYPMMGAAEGDSGGQSGDTGSAGDQSGDDTGDQDGDQAGDDNVEGEGDDESRVARASRQAANYRTQLRAQEERTTEVETQLQQTNELLSRLRSAITGEDDSGDGDPAEQITELTGTVDTLRSENADLQRALLVYELAPDNGGNPTALLDSRRFGDAIRGLDAEDADYRDQVAAAIKDAVSKNAAYRTGQGSGRGGSELSGEQREQQRQRPAGGLAGAIGAALNK